MRWLQNYISLNLSFSATTASGGRKMTLTVAAATTQIFLLASLSRSGLALLVSLKKS